VLARSAITPIMGVFVSHAPVSVGCEVYDVARDCASGSSRLRVAITLEHIEHGGLSGLAVRVLSGADEAFGLTRASRDGLVLSYDRPIPVADNATAAVLAESITLDGFGGRTGRYRISLTRTDLASGPCTARTGSFHIGAVPPNAP
jgi:hypothetical protein